uniref:Uncharacterized protein n=1 Tax=Arundo donax TaxID=35708 RepID=A0A0A9C795_ARUDO
MASPTWWTKRWPWRSGTRPEATTCASRPARRRRPSTRRRWPRPPERCWRSGTWSRCSSAGGGCRSGRTPRRWTPSRRSW